MAKPMKPLIRGNGYYPSKFWMPLVRGNGLTAGRGDEPEPPAPTNKVGLAKVGTAKAG